MFAKLLILIALVGVSSVSSADNDTTTSNTTSSENTTTTTTTTTTTSTTTPGPIVLPPPPPPGFPGPPLPPGFPQGPRFPGPRGPPGRNRSPQIPIISDFLNGFNSFLQSLTPPPPGGRRFRREVDFQNTSNTSISIGFPSGGSLSGLPGIPDISNFTIPNTEDIVPEIPELSDPSNLEIPEIPNFSSLPPIPGLREAARQARAMVANEISAGADLTTGIHDAIHDGLNSSNPTEAIRRIVSTILNTYLLVARNCPFLIVGGYLMREGLLLSSDVLRTIAAVIDQIQGF